MTTKNEMLDNFDRFALEMQQSYAMVGQLLETGRYGDACKAMTAISATQARTSVSMRTEMVRAGLMGEDE